MDISVALSDSSFTMQWTQNNSSLEFADPREERRLDELSSRLFATLLPTILFVVVQIVVGVPGNLLAFLVYFRQFKVSATRVFVLAMAACDLVTGVFVLPLQLVSLRFQHNSLGANFCRVANVLVVFPILVSAWILVCVSLDRRRRICQPWKRQLSGSQATGLLVLPVALSCLVTFPFVAAYGERHLPVEETVLTGRTCGFQDSLPYRRIHGILMVASLAAGLFLMTFSYGNIACCIYRQKKKRERNFSGGQLQTLAPQLKLKESKLSGPSDASVDLVWVKDCAAQTGTRVTADQGSSPCTRNLPIFVTDTDQDQPDANRQTSNFGPLADHATEERQPSNGSDVQTDLGNLEQATSSPRLVLTAPSVHESVPLERAKFHKMSIVSAASAFSFDMGDVSSCTRNSQPVGPIAADMSEVALRNGGARSGGSDVRALRRQRGLCSRTTLMMFVLTVTVLVCFLPFAVASVLDDECISLRIRSWTLNLCGICRYFPCVNSVVNPFIYSFCNPRFRLQCRQFLAKARSYLGSVFTRLSRT